MRSRAGPLNGIVAPIVEADSPRRCAGAIKAPHRRRHRHKILGQTLGKSVKKSSSQDAPDLFGGAASGRRGSARRSSPAATRGSSAEFGYTAKHIEVLEGLEPVRRRPGMYIGGTDEKALHHLFAEVIDNAMDEALAGHADWIEVEMEADGFITVTDNGRGMPVDPHPKFPKKSAIEVIMCTLHAGGNSTPRSTRLRAACMASACRSLTRCPSAWRSKSARGQKLYRMIFERGKPKTKLLDAGKAPNRRGTKVRFRPDPQIFGDKAHFRPERRSRSTRSKAYLFGGVEIRWSCAKELLRGTEDVPGKGHVSFRRWLERFLSETLSSATLVHSNIFTGSAGKIGVHGGVQWAVAWTATPTALSIPTAIQFQRRTVAPTSSACAPHCCAG